VRRAGLGDLHHAARAVQAVPAAVQQSFCAELLCRAHMADKVVKRLGRLHHDWGDGSLRTAALAHPRVPEKDVGTPEYLVALACVAMAVSVKSEVFCGKQVFSGACCAK